MCILIQDSYNFHIMRKLFLIVPTLFLLTACGGQKSDNCIDNCKAILSAVCEKDQTETCTNLCNEDEEVRNCVMAAESCEELDEKATLCFSKPIELDESVMENEKESKTPTCESVCQKYADCAGFGEGVTEADQKDAYESCMIECPSWSAKGLVCMDSKEIKEPIDCTSLSLCGAMEYQNKF